MDDMSAFERQLAARLQRMAGPEPFVDVSASVRAATTTAPRIRLHAAFSATRFVVAGVIVALFGGLLLAGVLSPQAGDQLPAAGASASPSPETSYVVTRVTNHGAADGAWNLISTISCLNTYVAGLFLDYVLPSEMVSSANCPSAGTAAP